jgi:FkbM family methyltransferase
MWLRYWLAANRNHARKWQVSTPPGRVFVRRRRSLQKYGKAFYGFARPPSGGGAEETVTGFLMDWMELLTPSFEGIRRRLRGEPRYEQQVALPKLLLGSDGRGFAVVPDLMLRSSIVYAFGVGVDADFELEMIGRFGCTLHVFEPRPRHLHWIRMQSLPPQISVHPMGLSDRDGVMTYGPIESAGNGHGRRNQTHLSSEYQVRRLPTLMKQFGHPHVDVLKLELEGAEYLATHSLITSSVRPTQILIEFQHGPRPFSVARAERVLMQLNQIGYRIFDCQPGGHRFSLALV